MAITRDSTVDTTTQTTWSHTCAAGAVLYVMFYHDGDDVTAVTYDGTAMVSLVKFNYTTTRYMHIYGLLSPAAGAKTVAITAGAGNTYAGSASYLGVENTAFSGIYDTSSTPGGNEVHLDLTTLVDKAALIGFCLDGVSTQTRTANVGSAANTQFTGLGICMMDSSPLPTTPAGAQSIGYSCDSSATYLYMCGTVINPSPRPTTAPLPMFFQTP